MSGGIAANDGQVTEWGRFIDEDQLEEIRNISRSLAYMGKAFGGRGDRPKRRDMEALFKVFYERLEDIIAQDMPVIELVIEDDGGPSAASVT